MNVLGRRTLSCVSSSLSIRATIRNPVFWVICFLVVALAYKYLWSLFVFNQPMGYDVGFYRYLFIRHAEGFPPFFTVPLEPWARGHPLGLFFFSTILMRLGVPVDWLIGWIWNVFAIVFLCTFSWISAQRYGKTIGVWTLVATVLSVSTFDGFAAMYMKTLVSLLWMILAFRALEQRSWLIVPYGILTVVTHHQTGLLFGLVIMSYFALPFIPFTRSTSPLSFRSVSLRDLGIVLAGGLIVILLGALAYAPIWKDAILQHVPALLGETEAASGSFPPATFYLHVEAILLFFGGLGFYVNVRKERWTVWQLSVLWSLLFVVMRLLFYRRFFLQLEFFLLPFSAIALDSLWRYWKDIRFRSALTIVLLVQMFAMQKAIARHGPLLDHETFAGIIQAVNALPADAFLLGLENVTPVMLRGWYPHQSVGGPGLFDAPWSENQWRTILLGEPDERIAILRSIPGPLYLVASAYFHAYYKERADVFLQDPCFQQVDDSMYYHVVCMTPGN